VFGDEQLVNILQAEAVEIIEPVLKIHDALEVMLLVELALEFRVELPAKFGRRTIGQIKDLLKLGHGPGD